MKTSLKKACERISIPMRMQSDADLKLRAHNLARCERIFQRTLKRLKSAHRRSNITAPVILPSHPTHKAHENVLPINGVSFLLLSIYDENIATAIKRKDAELAALLGIELGQAIAGLPLHEVVRRGSSGGKRKPATVARQQSVYARVERWVKNQFMEYQKHQEMNDAPVTENGFREFVRPFVPTLAKSADKNERAIATKLKGRSGRKKGDGLITAKQLSRINSKNTPSASPI